MAWLENALINRAERQGLPGLDYARDIVRSSTAGFWKLALITWIVGHRRHAPKDIFYLTHLGAMLHEDCGPCVRIVIMKALRDGIDRALIGAALGDGAGLSDLQRDALRFGREVAAQGANSEDLRLRMAEAIGEKAMVDLAFAIAVGRVFPAMKRALGRHTSCALAPIEI